MRNWMRCILFIRVELCLRIRSASLLIAPPSVNGLSHPSNSLPKGLGRREISKEYTCMNIEYGNIFMKWNLKVQEDSSLGRRASVSSSPR